MISFNLGDVYMNIIKFTAQERKFDVVYTDPPYTEHVQQRMLAGKKASNISRAYTRQVSCDFEALSDYSFVPALVALSRRWTLIHCAVEQLGAYKDALPELWVRSGIYCKLRAMPQMTGDRPGNRCEGVSIFHAKGRKHWNGGGGHAYWAAMPENRKVTRHPTAKPLLLAMRLVDLFTDPGDEVFDPFCGTGTIGIACGLLGRNYYGVDNKPKYIDSCRFRAQRIWTEGDKWRDKYAEYVENKGGY